MVYLSEYAHSIKNPHIKHWIDFDGGYLCNKACSSTPSKSTRIKSEVTCKNCLRSITNRVTDICDSVSNCEVCPIHGAECCGLAGSLKKDVKSKYIIGVDLAKGKDYSIIHKPEELK